MANESGGPDLRRYGRRNRKWSLGSVRMTFAASPVPRKREPPAFRRDGRVWCRDRPVVAGGGVVPAGFPSAGHGRPRDRILDPLSRASQRVGSPPGSRHDPQSQPGVLSGLLERERDWHRRLPLWFLPPAALSPATIALTFFSSARFAHTPVFFAMLAWLVGGGGPPLLMGLKRSRREADRWQRELDALGAD